MKWTIKPPTKPGWYWAKRKKTKYVDIVFVVFNSSDSFKWAEHPGSLYTSELNEFTHWYGPLKQPEF